VQSRSIVICFIIYRDILEANAARFVITHKIYSTKYDDPGIRHRTKNCIRKTRKPAVLHCGIKLWYEATLRPGLHLMVVLFRHLPSYIPRYGPCPPVVN
jgi:hypothetical protein